MDIIKVLGVCSRRASSVANACKSIKHFLRATISNWMVHASQRGTLSRRSAGRHVRVKEDAITRHPTAAGLKGIAS